MVTVEEYFGKNVNAVWQCLKENGPLPVAQIKRKTGLSDAELYGALGWMAHAGKVNIIGDVPLLFKFCLRD